MLVQEIAELVGGQILGDGERDITNVRKIEEAGPGDISFIANLKYAKFLDTTHASALLVGNDFATTRQDMIYIRTADPYAAFLTVLKIFAPQDEPPVPGVHPTAVLGDGVTVGEGASIGPYVVIGGGCTICDRAVIYPHTVLGSSVMIGEDTIIHANVTLYRGTRVGNRSIISSGTVIGADGFGFAPQPDGSWEKIPQTGIVVIEDDVEIGANVTIDRATLGETRICRGVKLDNLIHIAHNVVIGPNTVIAAQAGISGSTHIGEGNMIAGQVGIVGHIETVPNVIVEAGSGVSKSIRKAGRYFGHPVKEHAQALRQEGALRQLPDLLAEIREMRNRIAVLETALSITETESGESESR
ncbi:MAG: UDP-3-O-(3-hydroxymyristoyl)glucosamine N-acyltransferase [Candidatus Kapaibacterium sp.]